MCGLAGSGRLKRLRGTPLDLFGYTAERKMERALIRQYEADMKAVLPMSPATSDAVCLGRAAACTFAGLACEEANEAKAAKRREELLSVIQRAVRPCQSGGIVRLMALL